MPLFPTPSLKAPMVIELDLTGVGDTEQLLDLLDEKFGFPGWFGRNLDALIDCLLTFYFPQESLCELVNHSGGETILACRIASGSEKHLLYLVNALGWANEKLSNTGISGRFSLRPVIV